MAEDRSRATYHGCLIVPDTRLEVWDAESSYSQAGPRPGGPIPQQATGMQLRALGDMPADTDLRIRTQQGGHVDPRGGATFLWKTATASNWYGWEVPSTISHWESPRWTDGTGDLKYALHPHALGLSDGSVLVVHEDRDIGETSQYGIVVARRAAGQTSWGLVDLSRFFSAPPTNQYHYPCLLELPSGRLQAYAWIFNPKVNKAQVRMWFSDDQGETWAVGQNYVLDGTVSTSGGAQVRRLRVAYANGTVLLLAGHYNGTKYTVRQYASNDLGLTFSHRGTTEDRESPDVCEAQGVLVVAWQVLAGSTLGPQVVALGNAYTPLASGRSNFPSGGYYDTNVALDAGQIAITSDDDGTIYLFAVDEVSTFYVPVIARSANLGDSWTPMGQSSFTSVASPWLYQQDNATLPTNWSACSAEGRLLLAHGWESNPADEDVSLGVAFLGGYSDVCLPGYGYSASSAARVGWETSWLPIEEPDDAGIWTAADTGTPVASLESPGRLYLNDTAGNAREFSRTINGGVGITADDGYLCEFAVQVDAGGTMTGSGVDDVAVRVVLDDGTQDYSVVLRLSGSGFKVYDDNGASELASVSTSLASAVAFRFAVSSSGAQLWYRTSDSSHARAWTAVSVGSLVDGGGGAGTSTVTWGHLTSSSGRQSYWFRFLDADDGFAGSTEQLADGQTNPDDLPGRTYSADGAYVTGGSRLVAVDGPTIGGDTWTWSTRYRYGLLRALNGAVQNSPRVEHRTLDTSEQVYAFRMSSQGDSALGSDVVGIAAVNCNWTRIVVDFYDDNTSSWVDSQTVDLHDGLDGLAHVRQGETACPDTGNASTEEPYLYFGEATGWAFWFDGSNKTRRVTHNSAGKWTDGTAKVPELWLESVDGTEGSGSTDGRLVPSSWALTVSLRGARYSGVRITVKAPTASIPAPPDDYWKVGHLLVGHLVIPPKQISDGRIEEVEVGYERTVSRDGQRQVRVWHPARRSVVVAWSDLEDLTTALDPDGDPDPGYVTVDTDAGADPVAGYADTPMLLDGLTSYLNGAQRPLVYLPRVPRDASQVHLYNRRREHMLVELTSPIRTEQVMGDELVDEVVRVAAVDLLEVV